ncbi:hypothetical protein RYZ26_00020 [Terasakiella sp. A23]|uniref:P-II family nitrogen regulator n=1 Tax=Terasakiella sp. FCG-A23 TaxID=3080561 RepID=UPI00295582DE|nr:hypothetical protein [Terasakiella sp. A23]MDV7337957.1 hypothetical protein [Terasakiella sp. A23]
MQTYKKIRVEVVIEQPAVERLAHLLDEEDHVSGYTIVPVHGGSGVHGLWTRDGMVTEAEGMMMVICILDDRYKDELLEHLATFLKNRIGIVTASEVEVLRNDHF